MPDEKKTSATRVKSFVFENDTNENIFSHPHIYYIASERLRGEEQFYSKNYVSQMSYSWLFLCQNAVEKCTTKTEQCNVKSYIKRLDINYIVAGNALALTA